MDANTNAKVKSKDTAYQKFVHSRDKKDWNSYARIRNQARWETRKAKREFEKKIAKEAKINPKTFFNYARSKVTSRVGVSDLTMPSGETTTTDTEKAETLNDFFSSVFTQEDTNEEIPEVPPPTL